MKTLAVLLTEPGCRFLMPMKGAFLSGGNRLRAPLQVGFATITALMLVSLLGLPAVASMASPSGPENESTDANSCDAIDFIFLEEPSDQLLEKLRSPFSLDFENIYIGDILNFVADTWEINIILDQRVIRPKYGKGSPYNQDRYVTDGWVTYICLLNLPMLEALESVLTLVDLFPFVIQNHVWVTAPPMRNDETETDTAETSTTRLEE